MNMSIFQYPEATATNNSTELHVWHNAAFDGEELQGFSFPMKTCSWSTLHPSESDCSKENLSPAALNSPVPAKSSIKPRRETGVFLGNSESQSKPMKKNGLQQEYQKNIDDEIEEIENEIKRLSTKLEALRLEKASKTVEKRGRIVAAKFMEPKQVSVKVDEVVKKIEDTPKAKVNMRRGVSLGPSEIVTGGGGRSRKADVVIPFPGMQSRRKSCFLKLQEVDEEKEVSERRKSLSVCPKSGKFVGGDHSIQGQRQAATTTLGSRKCVKKEDRVLALVQPRKLFKEGGKSVPNKKPLKPGRVVASRYNQIANQSSGNSVAIDAKKRSLPEHDKDDYGGRCDKRRASSVKVKKRWEIPAEVALYKSEEEKLLLLSSVADMSDVLLPKIRTLRCANESPRDSGAAKRVAELTGKRSYFCPDEDVEASVCQVLNFAEDDANKEE